MTTQAKEIRFADFVEESLTAVSRVIELRKNDDKNKKPPWVTIGLVVVDDS